MEHRSAVTKAQIMNLRKRLKLTKFMQLMGDELIALCRNYVFDFI